MVRRLIVIAVVLAFAGAACGGGADEDSDALAQAISDGFMTGSGPDNPFTQEQADCIGTAIVDDMSVSRLVELGLSLDAIEGGADPTSVDIPPEDADVMIDAMLGCIDFGEIMVNEAFADANLSDQSSACMAAGFNESDLIKTLAKSEMLGEEMSGDAENQMTSMMIGLMTDCLTADELSSVMSGG